MDGFRNLHGRLKEISSQPKSSEEQVRIWCIDALRDALGYQDDEIDTECKVLSGKVDIALKKNDRIFMVIECKNMRSKLGASVRDQAGTYAATLSADWAVITNGDLWKMYRVCAREGQTPHLELVFDVALLDEDGVSEIDAANLYLLTARAIFTGDADREFHEVACTSPNRLYDAIFSDRAIVAVRRQLIEAYEESEGQRLKLEDDEVKSLLKDLLTPLEL